VFLFLRYTPGVIPEKGRSGICFFRFQLVEALQDIHYHEVNAVDFI